MPGQIFQAGNQYFALAKVLKKFQKMLISKPEIKQSHDSF